MVMIRVSDAVNMVTLRSPPLPSPGQRFRSVAKVIGGKLAGKFVMWWVLVFSGIGKVLPFIIIIFHIIYAVRICLIVRSIAEED